MWKSFSRILPGFLILLFLSSCSGSPPEISSIFWRLEVAVAPPTADEAPEYSEYLRLFLLAEDRDGDTDLDALHVSCEQEGLVWKVEGEDLQRYKERDETWLGHSRLESADASMLPRGQYEVKLFDRGGKWSEYGFSIDRSIEFNPEFFPRPVFLPGGGAEFRLAGGSGRWLDAEFRFYGDAPEPVMVGPALLTENGYAQPEPGLFSTAREKKLSSWYFYAYDRFAGTGILQGPFDLSM
jgi:hypothetical protein